MVLISRLLRHCFVATYLNLANCGSFVDIERLLRNLISVPSIMAVWYARHVEIVKKKKPGEGTIAN